MGLSAHSDDKRCPGYASDKGLDANDTYDHLEVVRFEQGAANLDCFYVSFRIQAEGTIQTFSIRSSLDQSSIVWVKLALKGALNDLDWRFSYHKSPKLRESVY